MGLDAKLLLGMLPCLAIIVRKFKGRGLYGYDERFIAGAYKRVAAVA
jgi:hypothetical protein